MFQYKTAGFIFFFLCLATPMICGRDTQQDRELFPVVDPFHSGRLKVSDLHTIHFSLFGELSGKPVFVLHGGPGFGCYPRLMQYFNPEKYLIVLHDQRGAGRSTPLGELKENTTQHLVSDVEALRKHLFERFKLEGKILIFGGSWGTTLGLAYAETYPEKVSSMILRGVFLGSPEEINNVWGGTKTGFFFPKFRDEFEAALPPECLPFSPAVMQTILDSREKRLKEKVLAAWCRFSVKIGRLHTPDEYVNQPFGGMDLLPCARIDAHYMKNRCFLEEGQLLENARKIRDLPAVIINGRYDMICPPLNAYLLHRELPKSKLIIVEEAGHSEGEEGTTAAILEAVAGFE